MVDQLKVGSVYYPVVGIEGGKRYVTLECDEDGNCGGLTQKMVDNLRAAAGWLCTTPPNSSVAVSHQDVDEAANAISHILKEAQE